MDNDDIDSTHEDDAAPGREAIDGALARLYPGVDPQHLATMLPWSLGGRDPLDGISAYPRTEPVPHWHMVGYGLTELYTKESDDPEESGWGFELTFRPVRDPDEEAPPMWAAALMQNLARYVFTSGNRFEPGHRMNANGPIATDRQDSVVRALGFTEDPELGTIDTPHGRVVFLQVVGLAEDEYEAAGQWSTTGVLDLLEPTAPLHVTDVDRASRMADPAFAAAVREGVERDGSTTGALYVGALSWELDDTGALVRVGALQAPAVAQTLRGRLPFGHGLLLEAEGSSVGFVPGEEYAVRDEGEGALTVVVPAAALDELTAALGPRRGLTSFTQMRGLRLEVTPTVMLDEYGKETGEVVG
ncbi:suppressor of fused protein SUFU [Nocardiopsis sp. Huas11]|uniref:suppressor of fused domain protein n=1 Tax=Nocardiopsis sp. Huas11 TaxID=2183912 RepID=UPI000EB03FFD|nr:suppressor of fused domain protein [Nocardiopsis sp. Huas11]RKS04855.1 suppressor of fused protein SUFU [Nocardiopsis sp. Huas11]